MQSKTRQAPDATPPSPALLSGCLDLVTVVLRVSFCCFGCVVRGVMQVALCCVRVMSRRCVIAGLVMFGGFAMVPSRVIVMFRCVLMMFCCLL
jgi:hypothetical protein